MVLFPMKWEFKGNKNNFSFLIIYFWNVYRIQYTWLNDKALVATPEPQCKGKRAERWLMSFRADCISKGLTASAVTNQRWLSARSPWAEHVILSQGSRVTLSVCTFTMLISSRCRCLSFSRSSLSVHSCTNRTRLSQTISSGIKVTLLTFDLSCSYFQSKLADVQLHTVYVKWKMQPNCFLLMVINWFLNCRISGGNPTPKNKDVSKGSSQRYPRRTNFWFHKEQFSQMFFKEPSLSYLFYNLKNLLSLQRTFCEAERFFIC